MEALARKLGRAQKRTILSLSEAWGKAADHRAAKRLWYRDPRLVDHRHLTDNCWALTPLGIEMRDYLRARTLTQEKTNG